MINPNTIDVVTLVFIIFQFDLIFRTNKDLQAGPGGRTFPLFEQFRFSFAHSRTKPDNETIFTFQ